MAFELIHSGNTRGIDKSQNGLSLIELMIALLLSTLLTLGILTMYLDSNDTSRVSRSLARVQESGRIAMDLIARDLRMTGFAGCADPLQDFPPSYEASTLDSDFYGSGVRGVRVDADGWDDFVSNAGVATMNASAVTGSDVLQIRRANGPAFVLDKDMSSVDSVISTDSDQAVTQFRVGENALITNCVNADVFAVGDPDAVADNEVNHQPLSTTYPEGSRLFHFNTTAYWVGDTGRTDQQGNTVWALYQDGLEVVTGIERLQVLYGIREDDDKVRYESADDIAANEWNGVDVVQIGVLVSDEQSVLETTDTKSYDLPGLKVQPTGTAGADATYPDDGRLRTTFVMTVNLRNQIEDED